MPPDVVLDLEGVLFLERVLEVGAEAAVVPLAVTGFLGVFRPVEVKVRVPFRSILPSAGAE
jgi:hypothetical protein